MSTNTKQQYNNNYNNYTDNSENKKQNNNIIDVNVNKRLLTFIYNKISDSRRMYIIGLRVRPVVKMVWDSLDLDDKKLLRDAIESMVMSYADQAVEDRKIINVNINVNKIENRVENKSSDALDEICGYLGRLDRLVGKNQNIPPLIKDLIKKAYTLCMKC